MINSPNQIAHTYSKQFSEIAGKLSANAEVVLMACHVGSPENGGVALLSALAKKLNATVYGNQSWTMSSPDLFNDGWLTPTYYPVAHGVPTAHKAQKGQYTNALANEGKWTKASPSGATSVITNVYFDSFGKIHYDHD